MAKNAQYLIDMAADILWNSETSNESMGLRNQLYKSSCPKNMVPMLTTLVNGAAANKDQLLAVADEAGVLASLPAACLPLEDHVHQLTVVLYECLLGSRRVRGLSAVVEHVKANKAELQKTLAERRRRGDSEGYKPKKETPRYVRVNTLLCTVEDAVNYLVNWGMTQVELDTTQGRNTVSLQPNTFALDPHVPCLLVLPPRTNLFGDAFVEAGERTKKERKKNLSEPSEGCGSSFFILGDTVSGRARS